MSDKVEKFLHSMSIVFAKRFDDDDQQAEWFQMWCRALKPFDPWVIEAATARIIDNRTERSFPLVSEVRKACYEVLDLDRANNPKMKVEHSDQHADPYALADALIRCEMGRQAARANPSWLLALHDFCRENKRLPNDSEIAKCKRIAADFEVNYSACVTGNAGPFSRSLEKLGAAMIRRREKLRTALLGEEATA